MKRKKVGLPCNSYLLRRALMREKIERTHGTESLPEMVSGKQSPACELLLTINRLALVAIYEQAGSLGGYLPE